MLILCVFVYENSKRDIWTENRATWRENNGKAKWRTWSLDSCWRRASRLALVSLWSAAMLSKIKNLLRFQFAGAWRELLVWNLLLDKKCLQRPLTVAKHAAVMAVWQTLQLASSHSVFWGAAVTSASCLERYFMSHLSCLFESELTPWAQGHVVYLSLCLCVCVPTPASSVLIKSVSLLTCLHSYCSFHSPSPLPPPPPPSDCLHTLTWLQRSAQRDTWEYVFEQISIFFPLHFLHDCSALFVYVKVTQ